MARLGRATYAGKGDEDRLNGTGHGSRGTVPAMRASIYCPPTRPTGGTLPTPHISAEPGDFAEAVLLPGDPLRAKHIAEKFFDGARQVTAVRNMLGYTGTYKGMPVSAMGTGMGIPSASIYATELITEYGVKRLVRVGSCGGVSTKVKLRDVIVATGACTDSGGEPGQVPRLGLRRHRRFQPGQGCRRRGRQAGSGGRRSGTSTPPTSSTTRSRASGTSSKG